MTRPTWQRITEADSLVSLLLVAFLVRLVIIPLFYDDYNYWAFGVFTSFLLRGQNPYHIVAQDPTLLFINIWRYPPLYLLFTAPAFWAEQLTGQTIVYLAGLKIPFAIADTVSAFYLFKILNRFLPRRTSLRFTAFFALNPVVVFESAGGGFNDPIPIAMTVASFYYFVRSRDGKGAQKDLSLSALLLGLGIAAKIYPLLLLPVLAKALTGTRQRLVYLFQSLVPAAITSLPFLLWDWRSYIDLLAIRNVGGQHPLFPGLGFSDLIAVPVGVILVISLLYAYLNSMTLTSKISLLFLWVNLAVFAQSFNYMLWGVPFFTILVAERRRWFWLPLSPVITMGVALLFQGSYDQVGGATGIFYWTFHLFQLAIVPLRGSIALYVPIVAGLVIGEIVAGYYFLEIAGFPLSTRISHLGVGFPSRLAGKVLRSGKSRRLGQIILLCGLAVFSWGTVAWWGRFQAHQYPVVEGTSFQFRDNFHTPLLDYQWIFEQNGSYTIDPSQGSIRIVDAPNGTAHILRGWLRVTDGFHTSGSAEASFLFKFDGFLPGSTGMTIANMTDGQLVARAGITTADLLYLDQMNNGTAFLSRADNDWHNFTIQYAGGNRLVYLDGAKTTFPGGSFSRFILGNTDSRKGFHGSAVFRNVSVQLNDFPAGYQSQLAAWLAVALPALLIALLFVSLSRRARRLLPGLGQERTS